MAAKQGTDQASGGQMIDRKQLRLPVIITCNDEGVFCAEVPVIRGFTRGKTREEALTNIQEIVQMSLSTTSDECDSRSVDFAWEHVDIEL